MLIRAKEKPSRRYGQNLFLKAERSQSQKSAMVRRPYPPGISSKGRRRGSSDFGLHLKEKQMIRFSYGVEERQMARYFKQASKAKGNTADEFLRLLETRLDNVLYRAGLTASRNIARQLIIHKHIILNGKKVSIPSIEVRPKDVISVDKKVKNSEIFKTAPLTLKSFQPPAWLEVDARELEAKMLRQPILEDIQTPFDFQLLVEYYSR